MRRYLLAIALLCVASQANAANAYISEYSTLGLAQSGQQPQIAALPALVNQKVDFSGGVASATAFSAATKFIRVHCDAACSILVGGTATTSSPRIPLDGVEYFGVQPGAVLSVIANP